MNNRLAGLLALSWLAAPVGAYSPQPSGAGYVMTKDLFNGSGTNAIATPDNQYQMGFSVGDGFAGPAMTSPDGEWELDPGYYGGGPLGTGTSVQVKAFRVAPGYTAYHQDALQVGVPVMAPVAIDFTDQIDSATVGAGIHIYKVQDRLGTLETETVPVTTAVDSLQQTVTVGPVDTWEGNTRYTVVVSSQLHSFAGYMLTPEARTIYLTVLDPKKDNLLLQNAANVAGALPASTVVSDGGVTMQIPTDTLKDYAAVLSSKDPLTTPLRVDPKIVQAATARAQAQSGYRVPLVMREVSAYDSKGNVVTKLAKPAQITIGTRDATSAALSVSAWIRPGSLSLWTLDETHGVWLKVPDSQILPDGSGVTAPITSFSVFAVMGDAVGDASSVYAFPVPWRPHGPNAGSGPGQTGTDNGGITFGDLPSECTISIFTVSGDLVRKLTHSDLAGDIARETWDGKTIHGETAASGVYFWHVESASDSKNGKLMIIR